MQDNFNKCLKLLLQDEGGWSDRPTKDDPGGATMKGITRKTYSQYLKREATKEELRNIPDDHVRDIYKRMYWDLAGCDLLPDGLDYFTFDYAVNSGPGKAVRDLQRVLKVKADGIMGPRTLEVAAREMAQPGEVLAALKIQRMGFLRTLKNWAANANGWRERVDGVYEDALRMARGHNELPLAPVRTPTPKARTEDVSLAKTPEAKTGTSVIVGTIGTGAAEMAGKIEQFTEVSEYVMYAFIALTIIGGIATIYLRVRRAKDHVDSAA